MRKKSMHVVLMASILVFSSIAGCLGDVDDEEESKGTVIVSTYHVEQIVSAIVGDTLNVEVLAPSNVPVHDYEPSAADLVSLQGADMFFYHGLGLETWIDATMDSLGDDAPPSFSTHAMPTGQTALDYEGMLVDQLCKSLSAPGTTDVHLLAESMYFAGEIHSDNAAHNLAMPEDDHHDDHGDDDHDDHDHGDDDRDDHDDHDDHDHGDDDHDDHRDHDDHDHDGHEMIRAEETLAASRDCPAYTTISVYELEAGEYMLEFEAEDIEAFSIAIAAMGGAHHHHHDHGDEHGDEHDDHGDEHGACHDSATHEDHDEYTTEEDCEAAGHMWMEGEHDMDADEMIEMFDTDSDRLLSLSEFLTMAEEMGGDDHDHDEDSDDEDHTHEEDGHDDHDPAHEIEMAVFEIMFHMADMNEDENLGADELDRLMDAMEGDLPIDGEDMAEIYFGVFDEDENDLLSLDEFSEMMEMMMSEEDDHDHDHTDEGSDDEDHDDDMTEMMFAMYDADEDDNISMHEFIEVMEMMGDEHEEGVAFIGFHVEEEGDYGFAIPAGVELHILSMGGHEGHDHGSHGDAEMVCYDMSTHTVDSTHTTEEDCEGAGLMWTENQRPDDHAGEESHEEHRDEEDHDDHGDEEALAYDPHSWLDPVAYKAQVALVLGEMKTAFPDLADTFQTNADAFMASLDEVHEDYDAAFGSNGTCTNRTVAANHNAYSYIAYRYNLEFITVHGIDPEGEPSAADITEVVEKIEEDAITVLYIEEYTDETAINSIVDQTNGAVTVQTLYTMELPPKDSSDDYLSLMEKNLNSLKAGLGC
jgi:ABC-type Zn uptake system ZnuABC Zn-binding protein ZnuA/Ca2+-binding EF-hand superfamily protein